MATFFFQDVFWPAKQLWAALWGAFQRDLRRHSEGFFSCFPVFSPFYANTCLLAWAVQHFNWCDPLLFSGLQLGSVSCLDVRTCRTADWHWEAKETSGIHWQMQPQVKQSGDGNKSVLKVCTNGAVWHAILTEQKTGAPDLYVEPQKCYIINCTPNGRKTIDTLQMKNCVKSSQGKYCGLLDVSGEDWSYPVSTALLNYRRLFLFEQGQNFTMVWQNRREKRGN